MTTRGLTPAPAGTARGVATLNQRLSFMSVALVLLAFTVASLAIIVPAAWHDAGTLAVRHDIARWRAGKAKPTPETWEQAASAMRAVAAADPENPQPHDELGFLHAYRANSVLPVADLASRAVALADSADHFRRAAALRPLFAYSPAQLALAQHYRLLLLNAQGQRDPLAEAELWTNWDLAFRLGRNEPGVQFILGEIGFMRWATLDTTRQDRLRELVTGNPVHLQKPLRRLAETFGASL